MDNLVIVNPGVTIGADPELFLVKRGKTKEHVIGSETIIKGSLENPFNKGYGTVVTDGVQVELHPNGNGSCRQSMVEYLKACLSALHTEVSKHQDLRVSFDQMVTVSRKELMQLSDHAKFLGCKPSLNFYGRESKLVDGLVYRKRSASGHIHLGSQYIANAAHPVGAVKADRIIPALDILVGIIGVLLDRDPKAVERRKLYGRAGEYRLPDHGIEYRTLSNFWLISYPVMSLMMAQAKMAFCLSFTETSTADRFKSSFNDQLAKDALSELINLADLKQVEKAINKNDFDLAYSIYDRAIKPVMMQTNGDMGLGPNTEAGEGVFNDFEYFISKPLKEWFPHDPIEHWLNGKGRDFGWESYAQRTIRSARLGTATAGVGTSTIVAAPPPNGGAVSSGSYAPYIDIS